jgi:ATP-dependent metalloprotease
LFSFTPNENVIVIGATNFPESLDKALTRPGRFDHHVVVPVPDVRGRTAILKLHSKPMPISKGAYSSWRYQRSNVKLCLRPDLLTISDCLVWVPLQPARQTDVDLETIARGTPGFSGAELANLVNQAAVKAAMDGKSEVAMRHFEYAKDKIIMGAERKSMTIADENRRMVAFHEGGHALVALYTPGALPIHKATIMPRGSALGMVSQLPEQDELNWTKKQLIARLDVSMGGRCAEELIFGEDNVTSGTNFFVL